MAATVEARRLTEAHRLAQVRLGAQVVRLVLVAFPLLDPDDLDRSVRRWLDVVSPIVAANRRTSARLAANYLTTFRSLELGVDAVTSTPVLSEDIDNRQLATSLVVTGPAVIRRTLARGGLMDRALDVARATSSRAAMRHVLNGGRDTISATVVADRQALGWARATSGSACHFCAMLASRGAVYSDDTVHFEAHDGCSCSAEPVYRRDAAPPAGVDRYRQLWQESTAGLSGADARNAFRQALTSQR